MTISSDSSLKALILSIYSAFVPLFDAWHESQGTVLVGASVKAKDCLFRDIYYLGKIFACIDNKNRRLELDVLAKVLVMLKRCDEPPSFNYSVDHLPKIFPDFHSYITVALPVGDDTIPELTTITIINESAKKRPESVKKLTEDFLELINHLLLADGNITSNELTAFKALKRKLTAPE